MILLLSVSAIVATVNLMEYNRNKREAANLEEKLEDLQYDVDKKKSRLNAPLNDEYIERVAREKLGLVYSDEFTYINEMQ